ncbi:MAG: hypothetical protein WBC93_17540, partial [Sulfitobacter sp.]
MTFPNCHFGLVQAPDQFNSSTAGYKISVRGEVSGPRTIVKDPHHTGLQYARDFELSRTNVNFLSGRPTSASEGNDQFLFS